MKIQRPSKRSISRVKSNQKTRWQRKEKLDKITQDSTRYYKIKIN